MKVQFAHSRSNQAGSALALTVIMTGIALAILGSAMVWSSNTTRLTHRSIQHTRAILAAEGATEKVLSKLGKDFLSGGDVLVQANLETYRTTVPTSADSSFWNTWDFTDGTQTGRTHLLPGTSTNYSVMNSAYAGLRGYATTYRIVSHARDRAFPQVVSGGVSQEVQLAHIPIFQFAMYSSGDMEISCGQPFNITGRVHSNGKLYVLPDNLLTFQSDVTVVSDLLFQRAPLDTRGAPRGSVVYQVDPTTPVPALTLPIGTNNSPEAIRQIVQPPPTGEDPNSPLGRGRYYNQAELIIIADDSGVTATSGRANNFATTVPAAQVASLVITTNSFQDARESKTVRPLDLNVAALTEWSRTNTALGPINSVYVLDRRTLSSTDLAAVRLRNGQTLPTRGLTVATARPLYVLGHYNQTNTANLGTTNTISTKPASLVADAVTILSPSWDDSRSGSSLSSRASTDTTVNAAILTGVVETTLNQYSGGMENFPRFLETWKVNNARFTYNGSMVKMFASRYATNAWGRSEVYDPPARNWAFDLNFNDNSKLPPLTPSLLLVVRSQWATVNPDSNLASVQP